MGPMMGSNAGWAPMLTVLLMLLAVLVAGVIVMTRESRAASPGRRLPWKPDSGGGSRPVNDGAEDEPLNVLRERYAHGEISHADFVRALDEVLRAD